MPQFNQIHKLFCKYQLATRLGKEMDHLGRGPGLVVMGGDSYSKGRGFEFSTGYWMDMTFFHIDL